MRVFLDANVVFSAAYRTTGWTRVFFDLAAAGACTLVTSAFAIEEARRNLRARYPDRLPDLDDLVARIELCPAPPATALHRAAAAGLPPKDAPILAAAIEAACHILATGDRADSGRLFGQRIDGTVVMLPVDALEIILG